LDPKEKEKVLLNVQDLDMLITEMSSRIEQLENECPTGRSRRKKDFMIRHFTQQARHLT
jgi:hypothetical protein